MSELKVTKVYNVNDFLNWHDSHDLTLSPKYQRNPTWNSKAKSYLIDSIIRGLPIPQIFIRQIVDVGTRRITREVIDGQQRLRAIIEFVNNEFSIMKSHNPVLGGQNYSDLDDESKEKFLAYEFAVEVIKTSDDAMIYNMFARLNTNGVTLNKQEIRNAVYWGEFKVFAFEQSEKWRHLFIDINTFSDKQLSRMLDIEFMSSLIILVIDGVRAETPTVIDNYYKQYDEEFAETQIVTERIDKILGCFQKIFTSKNFKYFQRKNYFYTLFAFLLHQVYGIDNIELVRDSRFDINNIDENITIISRNLSEFESSYDRFLSEKLFDNTLLPRLVLFEQHHRTRTTSHSERVERIAILHEFLVT